jgi:hypothetical protein
VSPLAFGDQLIAELARPPPLSALVSPRDVAEDADRVRPDAGHNVLGTDEDVPRGPQQIHPSICTRIPR